ncbi:N-acetyl-1-D-myo-inositol-2-amino-2-deoxy-alpha-D-glucopyranoside deacetylase [Actinospica sp. MGRD01-02]|uniref:1D-myo-inositol 2-acetamido-2-deoxy-alpha-D-glucopyranoside deacetylase n=1 Tax=Actinospica acidithermotolerans TaxID=2828514 RepID=A0A941IGG6_9ACTN|nr:N-acetyl-1-D-myo-inositol-2-amino-2-deoxy-alpha-D-glucopyranoside deacetylase [Actinospica acidithermotolerans]
MLFVHAHPDDESINNGATMAKYAAQGTRITLVTCTRGELGEIIPPRFAHLAADREGRLGEHREAELAAAMKELGVDDHRFLGEPGEYRDSGMMGTEGNELPESFWRADVDEAAGRLADVIREVRPRIVVTYNEIGGYGHPDHIQAHRVALRAVDLVEGTEHAVDRVYFNLMPRSVMAAALDSLRAAGDGTEFSVPASVQDVAVVVEDDSLVSAAVAAEEFAQAKAAAMRAHATQITVDEPFYALSDNVGMAVLGTEYYRQARGDLPDPGAPVRTDLFAGLAG